MTTIDVEDLVRSIAAAVQYAAVCHPASFLCSLGDTCAQGKSEPAREAIAQILVNSRTRAMGPRLTCQDTGIATIFIKVGMEVSWLGLTNRPLQEIVDEGVRRDERSVARALTLA